jgi:hypothetical protein
MTPIDICNAALADFGHDRPITSLDTATDRSAEARRCALHYPRARRSVLAAFPWQCIREHQPVDPLAATLAEPGYPAAVADVTQAIAIISILDTTGTPLRFVRTAGIISTEAAAATIVFTADAEDPDLWPVYLQEAIIADLALRLARAMGASPKAIQAAAETASRHFSQARTTDSSSARRDPGTRNPYVEARA